jgi:hypothetical protein
MEWREIDSGEKYEHILTALQSLDFVSYHRRVHLNRIDMSR